jgi:hypothetical protein
MPVSKQTELPHPNHDACRQFKPEQINLLRRISFWVKIERFFGLYFAKPLFSHFLCNAVFYVFIRNDIFFNFPF